MNTSSNHPPAYEVQIHEGSAWSCSHGVGRWKENCGCNSGGHGDWHQDWRAPLRQALDWLRDQLAPLFEERARQYLKDPWATRNDYINVILDREACRNAFFERNAVRELTEDEKVAVLKLMEIQRHAMLMYTSCGWFFDELSGLETVQVIQYAARALQLAGDVLGRDLEPEFLDRLEQARSNIPEHANGREIYNKFVKPAMISWENVVAHYAISSVFSAYGEQTKIFLYNFEDIRRRTKSAGKARIAIGTVRVSFEITHETNLYTYAVLYMGEHHLNAAVRPFQGEDRYQEMADEIYEAFERADFAETIRLMDSHFGRQNYSLRSLFKDEQRRILTEILSTTREDLENRNRAITEHYTPLIRFLEDLGTPLPSTLKAASDFVVHIDLLRQFQREDTDLERLAELLNEVNRRKINAFDAEMSLAITNKMEGLMNKLQENVGDVALAGHAARLARIVRKMQHDPNQWRVRNKYWKMLHSILPEYQDKAAKGDEQAGEWVKHFLALGHELNFATPRPASA